MSSARLLHLQPSNARLVDHHPQGAHAYRRVRAGNAGAPKPPDSPVGIESSWGVGEVAWRRSLGDFNVDNALTVLATLLAWGVPLADATYALTKCRPPSGRMETFGGTDNAAVGGRGLRTHAGCAQQGAARRACAPPGSPPRRFRLRWRPRSRQAPFDGHYCSGAGGRHRDHRREPAHRRSAPDRGGHLCGPATRAPSALVVAPRPFASSTIARRRFASALDNAPAGDVVVVAGKGHEDYQIYGTERRPFSDQAVIIPEFPGERA